MNGAEIGVGISGVRVQLAVEIERCGVEFSPGEMVEVAE